MSSTQPADRSSAVNLERTRRQLRELENLLQQMLELPVEHARPETSPPSETEPAPIQEPLVSLRVYSPPSVNEMEAGTAQKSTEQLNDVAELPSNSFVAELPTASAAVDNEPANEATPPDETPTPAALPELREYHPDSTPRVIELVLHSAPAAPAQVIASSLHAPAAQECAVSRLQASPEVANPRPVRSVMSWAFLLLLLGGTAIALVCWLTWPRS